MIYINQLDYPDMSYNHNMSCGGAEPSKSNVKAAGCGLCCMCMIVENMTEKKLPLLECRDISEAIHANMSIGTNLQILGKEIANRYGLTFIVTDSVEEMVTHLKKGGKVIANVGGDREGYVGVFSHGGHYITVMKFEEDKVYILDPSYKEGKYEEEGRRGKVEMMYPYAICSLEVLAKECENRSPSYYLFKEL